MSKLIECPHCGAMVPNDRLDSHELHAPDCPRFSGVADPELLPVKRKGSLRARPLLRVVKRKFPAARGQLVVELAPGEHGRDSTITIRKQYERAGKTVTLAALYVILAQREADNARARRRPRRSRLRG
jgi:hypothetical protein